jgi:hypothetical protein
MSISTICRRFVPALGVLSVAGLLAACSGASQNAGVGVPQADGHAFPGPALRSGVYARFAGPAKAQAASHASPLSKIGRDLFVSQGGNDVLALKNGSYNPVGEITSGVNGSDGIWVDKHGNLYVSNFNSSDVTEYAPGGSSPICTYNSGILDPTNVTTDNAGNVYVVDFYVDQNPGYIDKFPQCVNTMSAQYPISSGPQGVAVDRHGDIFVSYYSSGGAFVEFKHGSSQATPLSVKTTLPGGLLLDKNDNLIADDDNSIVVIAPPYTTATPIVNSVSGPFRESLNRAESLLFSANTGSNTVTVYRYPSGQLLDTLGASNGITSPLGVAESPNASF